MSNNKKIPLAYLTTLRCYGTWLHGDARGSTTRYLNQFGQCRLPYNPDLVAENLQRLKQRAYRMDQLRRRFVRNAILEACAFKRWKLHSAHVRTEHAHAVVSAPTIPDIIISTLKSRASRLLNEATIDYPGRRRWAEGGSKIYLWTEGDMREAIRYVLEEQGEPMEVYRPDD